MLGNEHLGENKIREDFESRIHIALKKVDVRIHIALKKETFDNLVITIALVFHTQIEISFLRECKILNTYHRLIDHV